MKKRSSLDSKMLKGKWESIFAKGLTQNEKEQIYLNSYLWHIFSYEKKLPLKKAEARDAFNKMNKREVMAFYQHKKDVLLYRNANLLKDADFDMEDDIYLVDSDFQWTYVVTHESRWDNESNI